VEELWGDGTHTPGDQDQQAAVSVGLVRGTAVVGRFIADLPATTACTRSCQPTATWRLRGHRSVPWIRIFFELT
jgi:hypothetical protein